MAFPANYSFDYYSGDSYEFFVYPKASNGAVFDDLADYDPKFVIATARGQADSIVLPSSASAASTEILATVVDDHISCEILPAGGAKLVASTYLYDVEITNPTTGKKYTIVTGTISVTQDVAV